MKSQLVFDYIETKKIFAQSFGKKWEKIKEPPYRLKVIFREDKEGSDAYPPVKRGSGEMTTEDFFKIFGAEDLLHEIMDDGVDFVLFKPFLDEGKTMGEFRPAFNVIRLATNIDSERQASEIRRQHNIEIEAAEVLLWVLLHEYAHFKGRKEGARMTEAEADEFANKKFTSWKIRKVLKFH